MRGTLSGGTVRGSYSICGYKRGTPILGNTHMDLMFASELLSRVPKPKRTTFGIQGKVP